MYLFEMFNDSKNFNCDSKKVVRNKIDLYNAISYDTIVCQ